MISLTKKLLVSSALVAASFSSATVGMDKIDWDNLNFGKIETQPDGTRTLVHLELSSEDRHALTQELRKLSLEQSNKGSPETSQSTPSLLSRLYEGACSKTYSYFRNLVSGINFDSSEINLSAPMIQNDYLWSALNDVKETGKFDQKYLEDLADPVFEGILSPHIYEEGLTNLKSQFKGKENRNNRQKIKKVLDKFKGELKEAPHSLITMLFQGDFLSSLKSIHHSISTQKFDEGMKEFKEILTYYQNLQDSYHFANNIAGFVNFLNTHWETSKFDQNHALAFTDVLSQAVSHITTEGYERSREAFEEQQRELAVERAFEEMLAAEEANQEPFSVLTPFKEAANLVYKGVDFAIKNPGQAVGTLIVANAAAAAAFNPLAASVKRSIQQITPSLGKQFQVNQNVIRSSSLVVSACFPDSYSFGWLSNAGNLVTRNYGLTDTSTNSETILGPVTTLPYGIDSSSDGNMGVVRLSGTSIEANVVTSAGVQVTSPISISAGSLQPEGSAIAALTGGGWLITFGNSTAGLSENVVTKIEADGTASAQNILAQSSSALGYPFLTELSTGNAYAFWVNATSSFGVNVSPTATLIGTPAAVNFASPFTFMCSAGLPGGDAILFYGQSNLYRRIIQNGVPTGSELLVANGSAQIQSCDATVLPNDDIFVVLTDGNIKGILLDSTGTTPQTSLFTISTNTNGNPQGNPAVCSTSDGTAKVGWFATNLADTIEAVSISFSGTSTSTTGTPPSSTTGTPPSSTTGTPPSSTTGTPPSSTTGTPPSSTTGTPPSSTTGTPPSSTTGTPPSSTTGAPPSSTTGNPTPPPTSDGANMQPSLFSMMLPAFLYTAYQNWGNR